eukprot:CAMPEP_0202477926 /NCGR_PEP_ID=MMETSP1360-20130828/94191_1 /ASSEMBLY_ACC=CAM_ASM_000848 /TAXON_ID=515479 /ORGANISM="Licmophora paradoxa, Strain CCMP2313" /LENGTH=259 /DNA_ID=CAMNT_0049105183 /DNA_START=505 /DNA_END=1284 /DNA_ORIENTATION=+
MSKKQDVMYDYSQKSFDELEGEERRVRLTQIIGAVIIQTRWRSWCTQQRYLNCLADILIVQSIARRWFTMRKIQLSNQTNTSLHSGTGILGISKLEARGIPTVEHISFRVNEDAIEASRMQRSSSDEAVMDTREAQEKREMKDVLSRAKQLKHLSPEKGHKHLSSSTLPIQRVHPSKSWSLDKAPEAPRMRKMHPSKSWSPDNPVSNRELTTHAKKLDKEKPMGSFRARKAPSAAAIWKQRELGSLKSDAFVPSHGRLF